MAGFCMVCGSHNSMYHRSKHQELCDLCARETPDKVDFTTFDRFYWSNDENENTPQHVRRCVYADYLAGCSTLKEYIEQTQTEEV